MVPHQNGTWTVLLSDSFRKFHTQRPDTTRARIKFAVPPVQKSKIEVLTWSFPEVRRDGASLEMQWGTTTIPLRIDVGSGAAATATSEPLTPYLGSYTVAFVAEPGDTAKPFVMKLELFAKDGHLRGRLDPAFPDNDPEFDLVPTGEHTFTGRYYKNGHVFEQDEETVIVFKIERGRAQGFEMRFENEAYARAQRVK
jgi:hypothetical protein